MFAGGVLLMEMPPSFSWYGIQWPTALPWLPVLSAYCLKIQIQIPFPIENLNKTEINDISVLYQLYSFMRFPG